MTQPQNWSHSERNRRSIILATNDAIHHEKGLRGLRKSKLAADGSRPPPWRKRALREFTENGSSLLSIQYPQHSFAKRGVRRTGSSDTESIQPTTLLHLYGMIQNAAVPFLFGHYDMKFIGGLKSNYIYACMFGLQPAFLFSSVYCVYCTRLCFQFYQNNFVSSNTEPLFFSYGT
jgi:hypothetical protein